MNVIERAQAPTPKFFIVLRNIGLVLAAASGAIMAAPIALPAAIVTTAGYLAVAGGVISAVSQITTMNDDNSKSGETPDITQNGKSGN